MSDKTWWQQNGGNTLKIISLFITISGIIWGAGVWMAGHDAAQASVADTLVKVSDRVDDNASRLATTETRVEALRRDSDRIQTVSENLQSSIADLREVTAELRGVLKQQRRAKKGRKK